MSKKALELGSRTIYLRKPITNVDYRTKTVLTNSAWEYVELWLMRYRKDAKRKERALFYWRQARNFYIASEKLSLESKPLTAYYCCLNASKALLAIRGDQGIDFQNILHGVGCKAQGAGANLKETILKFGKKGVYLELMKYFGISNTNNEYNVYELLYNIPIIHRTFSITYNKPELFIPVKNIEFVVDQKIKKGWLEFEVDRHYANGKSLKNISNHFERIPSQDSRYLMRCKRRFAWDIHINQDARIEELSRYHSIVRKDFYYIYGDTRLWYIKKDIPSNNVNLNRNSVLLMYPIMHWLSELTRYNPEKFSILMQTKCNWLIHEFIENALVHFIDEISCEMTSSEIMVPGYKR